MIINDNKLLIILLFTYFQCPTRSITFVSFVTLRRSMRDANQTKRSSSSPLPSTVAWDWAGALGRISASSGATMTSQPSLTSFVLEDPIAASGYPIQDWTVKDHASRNSRSTWKSHTGVTEVCESFVVVRNNLAKGCLDDDLTTIDYV